MAQVEARYRWQVNTGAVASIILVGMCLSCSSAPVTQRPEWLSQAPVDTDAVVLRVGRAEAATAAEANVLAQDDARQAAIETHLGVHVRSSSLSRTGPTGQTAVREVQAQTDWARITGTIRQAYVEPVERDGVTRYRAFVLVGFDPDNFRAEAKRLAKVPPVLADDRDDLERLAAQAAAAIPGHTGLPRDNLGAPVAVNSDEDLKGLYFEDAEVGRVMTTTPARDRPGVLQKLYCQKERAVRVLKHIVRVVLPRAPAGMPIDVADAMRAEYQRVLYLAAQNFYATVADENVYGLDETMTLQVSLDDLPKTLVVSRPSRWAGRLLVDHPASLKTLVDLNSDVQGAPFVFVKAAPDRPVYLVPNSLEMSLIRPIEPKFDPRLWGNETDAFPGGHRVPWLRFQAQHLTVQPDRSPAGTGAPETKVGLGRPGEVALMRRWFSFVLDHTQFVRTFTKAIGLNSEGKLSSQAAALIEDGEIQKASDAIGRRKLLWDLYVLANTSSRYLTSDPHARVQDIQVALDLTGFCSFSRATAGELISD